MTIPQLFAATDKSTRAVEDAVAEAGTGCTRPDERVLAAFRIAQRRLPTRFESCRDVPFGGVLGCPCRRRWRRMVCFDISMIV